MKRLWVGLGVMGALALGVAVVAGFVERGSCGSFLLPKESGGAISCFAHGEPGLFWQWIWIGVALLLAAVIAHQFAAHMAGRNAVSSTPPVTPTDTARPGLAGELLQLKRMLDDGLLSRDEFEQAKAELLSSRET